MKFSVSEMLTLANIKTEGYKLACSWAKVLTEKNFDDNVCYPGKLLKIESVEIVRNRGTVVPWITFYSADYSKVYKISANGYDSSDNFTITFEQRK